MCGGVIFPYNEAYRAKLAELITEAEIERAEASGHVRSVYWQSSDPVLPVMWPEALEADNLETVGKAQILRWGNRDKNASFPQTGWARTDSIDAGKWQYLRPKPVLIPVSFGVEKGKWFPIEHAIRGVIVTRGGEQRVFMLTTDATPDFLAVTKHTRMPVLVGQSEFNWLPSEPYAGGTNNAPRNLALFE